MHTQVHLDDDFFQCNITARAACSLRPGSASSGLSVRARRTYVLYTYNSGNDNNSNNNTYYNIIFAIFYLIRAENKDPRRGTAAHRFTGPNAIILQ